MKKLDFANFRKDEGGSITAFLLIMFLIMIVAGGMAVDFMRHESERVLFQDVLDRAVLATASFDSADTYSTEAEIQEVIMSHFTAAGYDTDFLDDLKIYADVSEGSRRVDVSASFEIRTFFLRIMNKPTLTLAARSTAETKRSELELSLVVDISKSMTCYPGVSNRNCTSGSGTTKLASLKSAANNFINLVLAGDNADKTSISIVPFSATVEPGEHLAGQFAGFAQWHNYSYCFEFQEADFNTTEMRQVTSYTQGQSWRPNGTDDDFRWCPRTANQILPFSNDPIELAGAINSLTGELYTSTWMGAKWGAALLDPSLQPVVSGLINTVVGGVPVVHPDFEGAPADWNDDSVVKYLVIMTDGDNTQHRWMTHNQFNHENTQEWNSQENVDYWEGYACTTSWNGGETCSWGAAPAASQYVTWDNASGSHSGFGDTRMINVCNAAKNIDPISGVPLSANGQHRIVIYTIGFDIDEGSLAHEVMLECASEPSKYYHASNGTQLDDAFALIAASIQKLKLVVN